MPWVRLDEEFPDHPKVVTAGPLAGWLHVCALAYCNRHLTDGFVPRAQVSRLVNFDGMLVDYDGDDGDARLAHEPTAYELAGALVSVGMWEERQGGYLIHDFLDYQPSRAEIEAMRQVKKRAGKAGGVRSGESRRSRTEAEPKQTVKQNGSRPPSRTEANSEAKGEAKAKPVPDTDTDRPPPQSSSAVKIGTAEGAEEEELRDRVTTAARLVAERRLAARTGEPLTNATAWLRTVRAEVLTDHGAELSEMAAQGRHPKAMADRIMPPAVSPYPDAGEDRSAPWDEAEDERGRFVAVPRRTG